MINATYPPGLTVLQVPGLTQYDTGQQIRFEGTGVTTETVQVHFAASGQSPAILKTGTVDDGVITAEIPDSVLASGRTVTAWVYVIDGTAQETKYTAVLPVVSRVRPQDYISPAEPPYLTANELDARVQANTDAIGALDGRVDEAETTVSDITTELTTARNGEASLDERLDGIDLAVGDRYTKDETDGLLAGIDAQLAEKANKEQEAWIAPTLLNGWAEVSGYPVAYRKNQLGKVEFKGRVTRAGGVSTIFTLPTGYKPLVTTTGFISGNSGGGAGVNSFRIEAETPSGNVYPREYSTGASLDLTQFTFSTT